MCPIFNCIYKLYKPIRSPNQNIEPSAGWANFLLAGDPISLNNYGKTDLRSSESTVSIVFERFQLSMHDSLSTLPVGPTSDGRLIFERKAMVGGASG